MQNNPAFSLRFTWNTISLRGRIIAIVVCLIAFIAGLLESILLGHFTDDPWRHLTNFNFAIFLLAALLWLDIALPVLRHNPRNWYRQPATLLSAGLFLIAFSNCLNYQKNLQVLSELIAHLFIFPCVILATIFLVRAYALSQKYKHVEIKK